MVKRDRDLNSVRISSERRSLHNYLERKAESAVQGENVAQKRSEAEAKKEIKSWEQKSSEMTLYETHRELESQKIADLSSKSMGRPGSKRKD